MHRSLAVGLNGKSVMITRPLRRSGELRRALETRGATVLECPTIDIVPPEDWAPVDDSIRRLHSYHWLLFTSANAVDFFMDRAEIVGVNCTVPAAAVGPATAARMKVRGLEPALIPREFRAEGLLEAFPQNLDGVRILFPRAQEGRDILPGELHRRGAAVDLVTVYRTVRANAESIKALLASRRVDCVVFSSPSAVIPGLARVLHGCTIAVLGPVTRQAAESAGLDPSIEPERATVEDLVSAIDAYYSTRVDL